MPTPTSAIGASSIVQAVGSKVVQAVGEKVKETLKNSGKKNDNKKVEPLTPEEVIQHSFADTSKLIVKQKFEIAEALTNAAFSLLSLGFMGGLGEQSNKYDAFTDDGGLQFRTVEESEKYGWTGRCLCRPHHDMTLHVHHEGKEIMTLDRGCKLGCCLSCCDCCRQEMLVRLMEEEGNGTENQNNSPSNNNPQLRKRGKLMAIIREPIMGGGLSPTLEVMDRTGVEPIATIQADAVCCIGGVCCDHRFRILKPQTNQLLGSIVKERPEDGDLEQMLKELFSDGADVFTLTLHDKEALPPEHKAALLAALHLIEYWLFEGEADISVNPLARTYNFKCCDLYCCGCVCPLACKSWCGGKCCCC